MYKNFNIQKAIPGLKIYKNVPTLSMLVHAWIYMKCQWESVYVIRKMYI